MERSVLNSAEKFRNGGVESYRKFMAAYKDENTGRTATTKHLNTSISNFKMAYKVGNSKLYENFRNGFRKFRITQIIDHHKFQRRNRQKLCPIRIFIWQISNSKIGKYGIQTYPTIVWKTFCFASNSDHCLSGGVSAISVIQML